MMLWTAVLVVTPLLILKMDITLRLLKDQVKYMGSDVQELMNAFTSLDLQEGGVSAFFRIDYSDGSGLVGSSIFSSAASINWTTWNAAFGPWPSTV